MSIIKKRQFNLVFLGLIFLLSQTACQKEKVSTYTAPKDTLLMTEMDAKTFIQAQLSQSDSSPDSSPQRPKASSKNEVNLTWRKPSDWEEKPSEGFRLASYQVNRNGQRADISIIKFPGEAGGLAANVNRWRGQLGLDSVTETEIKRSMNTVSYSELTFNIIKLKGTAQNKQNIIAAILRFQTETWFIKMFGQDILVSEEETRFYSLLKSFRKGG